MDVVDGLLKTKRVWIWVHHHSPFSTIVDWIQKSLSDSVNAIFLIWVADESPSPNPSPAATFWYGHHEPEAVFGGSNLRRGGGFFVKTSGISVGRSTLIFQNCDLKLEVVFGNIVHVIGNVIFRWFWLLRHKWVRIWPQPPFPRWNLKCLLQSEGDRFLTTKHITL